MKHVFTLISILLLSYFAKAGAWGMGGWKWSNDQTQAQLAAQNARPTIDGSLKIIDLEMAVGSWYQCTTGGTGTFELQYRVGDANLGGDPNGLSGWTTVTSDQSKAFYLPGSGAGNSTLTNQGNYSPNSSVSPFTGVGANGTAGALSTKTLYFNGSSFATSGKSITSSTSLTVNVNTLNGFNGNGLTSHYVTGAVKYALKLGTGIAPGTIYTFRLHATSFNWNGSSSTSLPEGSYRGAYVMNESATDASSNPAVGGGRENSLDNGYPTIETAPDFSLSAKFGTISPVISDNALTVNFETLSETNVSYYSIMASTDGKSFKEVGTVKPKGEDGNSSVNQSYSFVKDLSGLALGGVGLAGLLAMSFGFKRRNKIGMAVGILAISCAVFIGCNKNSSDVLHSSGKLFIQIVEHSKDGSSTESKIVQTVVK